MRRIVPPVARWVNDRSLCQDQARTTRRATPVIVAHRARRDVPVAGKAAAHRGHDETVAQRNEIIAIERIEDVGHYLPFSLY